MPTTRAKRTTLKCPRCHGRELVRLSVEGHEIDVCDRCGGLWCESWRWDESRLGDAPVVGPFQERAPDIVSAGPSKLPCPECSAALTALHVKAVDGLEIDQCDQCGGIWFDHREWDYLEALRSWQSHNDASDRPTSWGEWFFQILLRLPVEFNIPPRRVPFATLGIVVFCFLVQLIGGFARFSDFGVQLGTEVTPQDAFTLFTYQFVHGDWFHLFANMYFLYILGDNVEDVLGNHFYVPLFLLSGVAAAFCFLLVAASEAPPLVGASGSISGVMAAYLLLFRNAKLTFMLIIKQIKIPAWVWLTLWFGLQVAFAIYDPTAERTHVAWIAHVAGFIVGFVFVFPLRNFLVKRHPLLHLLHTRRL